MNVKGSRAVSGFADDDIVQIDTWLESEVQRLDYPSLVVGIVKDGNPVYSRAFGYADIDARRKATVQTQYHVASVTKVFTATLAVMLHEEGVIDLDDPVTKYLPDDVKISRTPEVGSQITFRQLASNRSGLPRGVPGPVQSVDGWYALEPKRLYDNLASINIC